MFNTSKLFIALIASCFIFQVSNAQNFRKNFISKEDSALDISGFLNSVGGFLPVPMIITEPATGYGGGLGLVFFHDKKNIKEKTTGHLPQIMTIVGGAYTENGSWLAFLGHTGSYLKDRIRYAGAIGYVAPNLSFYGAGLLGIERKYDFSMEGFVVFQEGMFRLQKNTPFFMGLNYIYFSNDISFKTGLDHPELDKISMETNNAGLNLLIQFDNKNNQFTPTKGFLSALEIGFFDQALGGDRNYLNFHSRNYLFAPVLKEKLFSAYRVDYQAKWDDVPFYALPFIGLRGIPALRYQDNHVLTLETEWRWQFYKRWSILGFIGSGFTSPDLQSYQITEAKISGGGGFRYFIAKDYGMHIGIDIAKGPEDWVWYLTIGSSWLR